jgi:hypothetical protein
MPITLAELHYCSADLRTVYAMVECVWALSIAGEAEFPEPECGSARNLPPCVRSPVDTRFGTSPNQAPKLWYLVVRGVTQRQVA